MQGIIFGQGRLSASSSANRAAWVEANNLQLSEIDEESEDQMRHDVLTVKAADLYRKMFGQRSSRHGWQWSWTGDPTPKDDIPEEALFRSL